MGAAVLPVGEGDAVDGDMFNVAPQQGGELVLPIGGAHHHDLRLGKLLGIPEHRVAEVFLMFQRIAPGQGIAVEGADLLLIQAEFLDGGVGILGPDLLQGGPAQTHGAGCLSPDAAVDKQDIHRTIFLSSGTAAHPFLGGIVAQIPAGRNGGGTK